MLVNMNHVPRYVEEKQCCIGAFDTPNLEILMAVIRAAGKREESVIAQYVQFHGCETPIHTIDPIMVHMTEEIGVPVCVVLDHGEDLNYVRKAPDLGLSAVMYDDSSLAYEESIAMTRETMAMAEACDTDMEAGIDIVTGHEGRTFAANNVGDAYTDPELAARYVEDTGIDTLAASAGAVRRFYTTKSKLDFDRIVKIKELAGLPLVIRGGSGVSVAGIQRTIHCGTRKINYFSYMSNAGVKAVRKLLEEKEARYFHDLANTAADAMGQGVLNTVSMFALEQA